jgi:hypothetical protein
MTFTSGCRAVFQMFDSRMAVLELVFVSITRQIGTDAVHTAGTL